MQDEINEKTVAFVIKSGKLSAQALAMVMREYLKHRQNKPNNLKVGKHKLNELLKNGGSYSS